MQPFTSLTGRAAPLPSANIDTDVIMPKQFLKGVDREGLTDGAFHDLRFDKTGRTDPTFVLNRPEWQGTEFLVVGSNFGCGSSREHAVWGLSQLGIRALIGTTFAGIFDDNCQRNGVLTISLGTHAIETITALVSAPRKNVLTVDLPAQIIVAEATGDVFPFAIDGTRKDALVKGLDAIGSTLAFTEEIRSFEQRHWRDNPWLLPRTTRG